MAMFGYIEISRVDINRRGNLKKRNIIECWVV